MDTKTVHQYAKIYCVTACIQRLRYNFDNIPKKETDLISSTCAINTVVRTFKGTALTSEAITEAGN